MHVYIISAGTGCNAHNFGRSRVARCAFCHDKKHRDIHIMSLEPCHNKSLREFIESMGCHHQTSPYHIDLARLLDECRINKGNAYVKEWGTDYIVKVIDRNLITTTIPCIATIQDSTGKEWYFIPDVAYAVKSFHERRFKNACEFSRLYYEAVQSIDWTTISIVDHRD